MNLTSARWKRFSRDRKRAEFGRCAVCGWDWKKRGGWLETHHLTYRNANHERAGETISLCGNRKPWFRHHKQGWYPLDEIRRDRQFYLTMKWSGILFTLPFRVLWWAFRAFWRLMKRAARSKSSPAT